MIVTIANAEACRMYFVTALVLSHTPFDRPRMLPRLCHTAADQCRGNICSCAAWTTLQCQLALLDPTPAPTSMVVHEALN